MSGDYVLGHASAEYQRLRARAMVWESASAQVLDRVGVPVGARCLDAGCGPGETMRLLAERVGPAGQVHGVDTDEALGREAVAHLHQEGLAQCSFTPFDLEQDGHLPGAPYDLVYARLLLFHVADRRAVVRRLWDAVAPGGHLVVQDHDLSTTHAHPALATVEEWRRVVLDTFTAAGRDVRLGHHLPALFEDAGVGAPDGTDVTGRLEPLARAGAMIAAVHRSLQPAAAALGVSDRTACESWQERFALDVADHGDHSVLWPLMIAAWRRRPA